MKAYVCYHICYIYALNMPKDSAAALNILTSGLGSLFNLSTEGKVRTYTLQRDDGELT